MTLSLKSTAFAILSLTALTLVSSCSDDMPIREMMANGLNLDDVNELEKEKEPGKGDDTSPIKTEDGEIIVSDETEDDGSIVPKPGEPVTIPGDARCFCKFRRVKIISTAQTLRIDKPQSRTIVVVGNMPNALIEVGANAAGSSLCIIALGNAPYVRVVGKSKLTSLGVFTAGNRPRVDIQADPDGRVVAPFKVRMRGGLGIVRGLLNGGTIVDPSLDIRGRSNQYLVENLLR